VLHSYC